VLSNSNAKRPLNGKNIFIKYFYFKKKLMLFFFDCKIILPRKVFLGEQNMKNKFMKTYFT
jgi:hypothetical protein